MIASNLGQIIGRAAYGLPEDFHPWHRTKSMHPGRSEEIVAFVRARGLATCGEIASGVGITSGNASVLLFHLHAAGRLRRVGSYRYRVP